MKNRGTLIIISYLIISGIFLSFIPPVQQLGSWIRLIVFHGKLSQAGLYLIYTAGILGLTYLLTGKEAIGRWSAELGLSSVIIWIVGTGLSLVSMQVVWGGMMWNEPFTTAALTIVLLGVGKEYLVRRENGKLKRFAAANVGFASSVVIIRLFIEPVMHPENPIGRSDSLVIKLLPAVFLAITLLAVFEYTRWRINQRY